MISDANYKVKRKNGLFVYDQSVSRANIQKMIDNTCLARRDAYYINMVNDRSVVIKFNHKPDTPLRTFFIGPVRCSYDPEYTELTYDLPNEQPTVVEIEEPIKEEENDVKEEENGLPVIKAPSVKPISSIKPTPSVKTHSSGITWWGWQSSLIEEIKGKRTDGRSVRWYVDFLGGTGKTYLCDHIQECVPDKIYIITSENIDSLKDLLESARKQSTPRAIIFNLTSGDSKTIARNVDLYRFLELFSDSFRSAWIIVLSNTYPTLDKMSMNRWIIRKLPQPRLAIDGKVIEVDATSMSQQRAIVKKVMSRIIPPIYRDGCGKDLMDREDIFNHYMGVGEEKVKRGRSRIRGVKVVSVNV